MIEAVARLRRVFAEPQWLHKLTLTPMFAVPLTWRIDSPRVTEVVLKLKVKTEAVSGTHSLLPSLVSC